MHTCKCNFNTWHLSIQYNKACSFLKGSLHCCVSRSVCWCSVSAVSDEDRNTLTETCMPEVNTCGPSILYIGMLMHTETNTHAHSCSLAGDWIEQSWATETQLVNDFKKRGKNINPDSPVHCHPRFRNLFPSLHHSQPSAGTGWWFFTGLSTLHVSELSQCQGERGRLKSPLPPPLLALIEYYQLVFSTAPEQSLDCSRDPRLHPCL